MRRKVSGYHIPMYVLEIVSLFHPFRNTTTYQKLGDAIYDIILVKHQVAVLIAVLRRPRSLRTIRTVGSFRPARMSYQVGQTAVAGYPSPMYTTKVALAKRPLGLERERQRRPLSVQCERQKCRHGTRRIASRQPLAVGSPATSARA